MIKTLSLLLRGSAAAAAEDLADSHALLLLDQQMRDAEAALARARRALAMAAAEDAQEQRQMEASLRRIAELEPRARAALAAGREDLAAEAAGTIADLEADADAARQARALFCDEIGRLRAAVARDTQRIAVLGRGRRLARAAEAVRVARRGRIEPTAGLGTLSDAEALLSRLRERQVQAAEALDLLDGASAADASDALDRRLAAAGFGCPDRPSATAVLARLRQSVSEGARP